MEYKVAKATAKYLRLSPKKARPVIALIRGKQVDEALAIMKYTPKKAARLIYKVLYSAMSNAINNHDMDRDRLIVHRAYVDEGPRLKRLKPRAFGRADIMKRRLSHITVEVREMTDEEYEKFLRRQKKAEQA
ncbi:50S ribosomal protein L22 [bacterium 3DAC]|jgi:large subunit ribosomal protein L22|nr:50S ribosomal protein L22 [Dictyoglomota bacterium]UZN23324.1 50S ribosomal protein L22 [bacterium 3DAC]